MIKYKIKGIRYWWIKCIYILYIYILYIYVHYERSFCFSVKTQKMASKELAIFTTNPLRTSPDICSFFQSRILVEANAKKVL